MCGESGVKLGHVSVEPSHQTHLSQFFAALTSNHRVQGFYNGVPKSDASLPSTFSNYARQDMWLVFSRLAPRREIAPFSEITVLAERHLKSQRFSKARKRVRTSLRSDEEDLAVAANHSTIVIDRLMDDGHPDIQQNILTRIIINDIT